MDKEKFESLIKKVELLKKSGGGVDLSTEEDLSLAIMNLISLEEHFFFTGAKTGKDEYFDFVNEVRTIRKEMFDRAYKTYSLFWAIRLKLINTSGFKKIAAEEKPWTYSDIVDKLVDCCD